MSSSSQLPLDAFPAWARLNDVAFTNVELQDVDGKGFGLVADTELGNQETGTDALIRIPRDLVLSAEAVEEYAKVDQNFRQLLEAVGYQVSRVRVIFSQPIKALFAKKWQSTRKNAMLYLLCHLIHSRRGQPAARGIISTPWTEYTRFLPRPIPIPTMWADAERLLLNGTSLQVSRAPTDVGPNLSLLQPIWCAGLTTP